MKSPMRLFPGNNIKDITIRLKVGGDKWSVSLEIWLEPIHNDVGVFDDIAMGQRKMQKLMKTMDHFEGSNREEATALIETAFQRRLTKDQLLHEREQQVINLPLLRRAVGTKRVGSKSGDLREAFAEVLRLCEYTIGEITRIPLNENSPGVVGVVAAAFASQR
ncbi:hypothetical protein Tco_0914990 [Tanacetum coccineum]